MGKHKSIVATRAAIYQKETEMAMQHPKVQYLRAAAGRMKGPMNEKVILYAKADKRTKKSTIQTLRQKNYNMDKINYDLTRALSGFMAKTCSSFRFLDLPAELRDMVYAFCLADMPTRNPLPIKERIRLQQYSLTWLLVCKQMRQEGLSAMARLLDWYIPDLDDLLLLKDNILKEHFPSIRSLVMSQNAFGVRNTHPLLENLTTAAQFLPILSQMTHLTHIEIQITHCRGGFHKELRSRLRMLAEKCETVKTIKLELQALACAARCYCGHCRTRAVCNEWTHDPSLCDACNMKAKLDVKHAGCGMKVEECQTRIDSIIRRRLRRSNPNRKEIVQAREYVKLRDYRSLGISGLEHKWQEAEGQGEGDEA